MTSDGNHESAPINIGAAETGPWDTALDQLSEWDPAWAEVCLKMATNPWRRDVLPRKLVELIGVMLNAQCTSLNPEGTRRHIRAALEAGASQEEILFVLKTSALGAIHSCSLGAPILLEEAKSCGPGLAPGNDSEATPFCDQMRAIGQWNVAWDPLYELDPVWTDEFFATAVPVYTSGVLSTKEVELLSVAFDASYTHLYAPGTRRHIKGALAAGASVPEIMEVLKLCVVQGMQSCNMGVPILAEELARR
jgi:alkylhydroperoxidase/carboxymuconolactone decarboxylase family protein YurZ